VRIHVDSERCQGHGRCYVTAPELFAADELGYGREIGTGAVPDSLVRQARLAEANCPEQAVIVTEGIVSEGAAGGSD
jgi:ferredoxin